MTYRTDYNITRPRYLTVRRKGNEGVILGIFYYEMPFVTFRSRRKEFDSVCAFFEVRREVRYGVATYRKARAWTISENYSFDWEDQSKFTCRMFMEKGMYDRHGIVVGYPKIKYIKDLWEFYKIIGYDWKKKKIDNSIILEDYFS